MPENRSPKVSIGLPVFNGEKYLEKALQSIVEQTFADFELIISDNASTDATREICHSFVTKDKRVRYFRHKKNLGAAYNYNCLVGLSRGKYFKWAAHDDVLAPNYLQQCLPALEEDPEIVISHPKTIIINERDEIVTYYDDFLSLMDDHPHKRFFRYLFRKKHMCNAIFGLIRKDVLKRTSLIQPFISSDRVLLGELILRGKVYRCPEYLFFRRRHPENSWKVHNSRKSLASWFDPDRKSGAYISSKLKLFLEYEKMLQKITIPGPEKLFVQSYLLKWFGKYLLASILGIRQRRRKQRQIL